jgi:hypothetical protein
VSSSPEQPTANNIATAMAIRGDSIEWETDLLVIST